MSGIKLEVGETITQYEIGGFIFRLGPPKVIMREEDGKTFMRVEQEMETIYPDKRPARPERNL